VSVLPTRFGPELYKFSIVIYSLRVVAQFIEEMKLMRPEVSRVMVVVMFALFAAFGACTRSQSADRHSSTPVTIAASAAGTGAPVVALPDFTALVDHYGSAVVNISVIEKQTASNSQQRFQGVPDDDPLFQFFFRRFGVPGNPNVEQPPMRGQGSGFIVSADGYILTNAHVVGDAAQVTVKLTDRREFRAKVIGADKRSDVAVIKIEANSLPTVKLGEASALKPGQWVVAIGSPFGFENSVTQGIVSATARTLGPETPVPFIQTDVPVNPGNSGGPLFNLNGEVVGINSQIYTRSGGFMGLSFAIPIDVARDIQTQIIKTGHVRHGRIGVVIQDVNAQLAQSFGLDRPKGALVNSVEKGGPGDKAGLKPGDIILQANDKAIDHDYELPVMISQLEPDKSVTLQVWRNRKTENVSVKLGEFKDEEGETKNASNSGDESGKLGLSVRPLTPQEKRQVDTDGSLVVVGSSGPAETAGVMAGDVILAVNGQNVSSVEQLRNAAKKSGKTVALLIQRQGTQVFVPLQME
jgi:serine protease Do